MRRIERDLYPTGPQWAGPPLNENNVRDTYDSMRRRAVRLMVLRVARDKAGEGVVLLSELTDLRGIVGVEQDDELPAGGWDLVEYHPPRAGAAPIVGG